MIVHHHVSISIVVVTHKTIHVVELSVPHIHHIVWSTHRRRTTELIILIMHLSEHGASIFLIVELVVGHTIHHVHVLVGGVVHHHVVVHHVTTITSITTSTSVRTSWSHRHSIST
jgi:hypothetical protein